MNERMKVLAEQAELYGVKEDRNYDSEDISIDRLEKFATLIVNECAEVAHCNFHVAGLTLGGILKEHFGVDDE